MTDADPALIEDVVAANRILYDQGVVDGFGHISARHDKDPQRFLLARSMAPGLVTAADIMEFDLDGKPVDPEGRTPYLERFIHSEIFKAQPGVAAIVHSHSPAVIPFGVVAEARLRPIYHMSSFLGFGVPVFEIRDSGGLATDMLIRTPQLGAALARTLGLRRSRCCAATAMSWSAGRCGRLCSAPSIPRSTPGSKPMRCASARARSPSSTTRRRGVRPRPTAPKSPAPGICGRPRRSGPLIDDASFVAARRRARSFGAILDDARASAVVLLGGLIGTSSKLAVFQRC